MSGKQYTASLILNFVSICALDHSTLKANMKAVLIGDYSDSEGQKVWLCWMCCWIRFFFVFLVNVGPADDHGQHLMWHCRSCFGPKVRGRRPGAAMWGGTDGQAWLWSCQLLPRAHHTNMKMVWSWTEAFESLLCLLPAAMWCFCGSSVFGWRFVLFCSEGVQFLTWHLCQGRTLTLKKGQGDL